MNIPPPDKEPQTEKPTTTDRETMRARMQEAVRKRQELSAERTKSLIDSTQLGPEDYLIRITPQN